jgi:hypothetical protein
MTDTVGKRQSDEIVSERIRFACNSLGISVADAEDMAQRAIVSRARANIKIGPDD